MTPETPIAPKTYHSRFPGSTYIDRSNVVHQFLGGQLTTSDSALIAELDKIAGRGGCPIYVEELVLTYEDKAPAMDVQNRAAEVIAALTAQKRSHGG